MSTTTEFLNIVEYLYDMYYETKVNNFCNGYNEIWLDLTDDYEYIGFTCR